MELSLLDAEAATSKNAVRVLGSVDTVPPRDRCDPSGEGRLGEPRTVRTTGAGESDGLELLAAIEDRGVRGCVLSCGSLELPLFFAEIQREDTIVTVTVHAAVHPDCLQAGVPVAFVCASLAESESWVREMELAIQQVGSKHWGCSRSFIAEQQERWQAEGVRCSGMTVAQYFDDIGLGDVYDATWEWCAGVLAGLEAKPEKTAADLNEIKYYKSKMDKSEAYGEMELTDYMNLLKHQDLVPAGQQVAYASLIADESDSSGHRKVGQATVFVSHVWKMAARDFFAICLAYMDEEDYAWVDLYLHNQYQGPVSSIGDENSEYWIEKFGSLIGGIGKVIAIVTNWESPVMLSRIWCLFELNAAIDTGAELRFVATTQQRMDLSLNLNEKFNGLDEIVNRIDVRDCDAKRPHEIQDKGIFLSKLRGIENEVNDKLRSEMRRWLAASAEMVIYRTDPDRDPLDDETLALEDGAWQIRLARTLERWPKLPLVSAIAGALVSAGGLNYICVSWAKAKVAEIDTASAGSDDGAIPVRITSKVTIEAFRTFIDLSMEIWSGLGSVDGATYFISIALVGLAAVFVGGLLSQHQANRQLRQPPMCGSWATRHKDAISNVLLVFCVIGWPCTFALAFSWQVGVPASQVTVLAGVFVWLSVQLPLDNAAEAAINRARLCAKVGWLRLAEGRALAAVEVFAKAHAELLAKIGPNDFDRWLAAAGYVRALCDAGQGDAAAAERAKFEAQEGPAHARENGDWLLFRAGLAVAARAPDTETLALLASAADMGCATPAGSRLTKGGLEGWLPEWNEFLARMASVEELATVDLQRWEAYRVKTIGNATQQVETLKDSGNTLGLALAARGLPEDRDEDIETRREQLLSSYFEHAAWHRGAVGRPCGETEREASESPLTACSR